VLNNGMRAAALATAALLAPTAEAASLTAVLDGTVTYDPAGQIENPIDQNGLPVKATFIGTYSAVSDLTGQFDPINYVLTVDVLVSNIIVKLGGAPFPFPGGPAGGELFSGTIEGPFTDVLDGLGGLLDVFVDETVTVPGTSVSVETAVSNGSGVFFDGSADVASAVQDEGEILAILAALGLGGGQGGPLLHSFDVTATIDVRPVPLPAALPMLAAALAGLGWAAHRRA